MGAGAGSAGTDGTPHGHQANHDVAKLEAPSQRVGPRMWCGGTHGGRRVWSLQAFEVGGRQEGRLPSGALLACLAVGLRAGFSKPFPRRELRCRLALEMVPDRPVALRRGDARNDRTSGAAPAPDTAARCTGPYLVRCSKRFHAGRRAGGTGGQGVFAAVPKKLALSQRRPLVGQSTSTAIAVRRAGVPAAGSSGAPAPLLPPLWQAGVRGLPAALWPGCHTHTHTQPIPHQYPFQMHLRWPDSRDSGVAAGAARAVPAHGVRHAAGWRLLPLVEAEWGGIPGMSRTRAPRCEGKAGFGATRTPGCSWPMLQRGRRSPSARCT